MKETFHLKIVFTRLYVLICLVLLIIIFSGVAISLFRNGAFLTAGIIVFTVGFIFYNKEILSAWFTQNLTITISDNTLVFEDKNVAYTLDDLKNYKIEYRSNRFYVFQVTSISGLKHRFKCNADQNSINFLDKFNELVKNYNNNNEFEKRIELIPPFATTILYQQINDILAVLIAIALCFHIYYSVFTSIGTLLGGLSYYFTSKAIRKLQIRFLEHLNSQNSIATFKV